MGYACPVCDAPQADGEHLANHLAFTALLHGDDHGAWLDDHVPDWAERDPEGLAEAVTGLAEETDHDTVFEDTTGGRPDVDVGGGHRHGGGSGRGDGGDAARDLDSETRRILEEARELTREMRSGTDGEE